MTVRVDGSPLYQLRQLLDTLPPAIPCPACGGLPFEVVGELRKCHTCKHTWVPVEGKGRPGVTPPLLEAPVGGQRAPLPAPGPGQTPPREAPPPSRAAVAPEAGVPAPAVGSVHPSAPRAAVLIREGFLLSQGRVEAVNVTDSAQVFERAAALGLRQVWAGPVIARALDFPDTFKVPPAAISTRFRFGVAHPWLDRAVGYGWEPSTDPRGLSPWLGMTRGAAWVDLVVAGWSDDNPFRKATSAAMLLEALGLFSTALGLRFRRSPGATGTALMRAVHEGPGGTKLPEAHVAPPGLQGEVERGAGQSKAPEYWIADQLPTTGWLHGWDLNGMYLAAASSAELGFGVPERRLKAPVEGAGYWRAQVKMKAEPAFPLPFIADGKLRWYTAPALEFLAELGAKINVREAWIYPERKRWLEPWYARLRDARTELGRDPAPAARLALDAVKLTYTQALGRLAGRWLQGTGDDAFRPDWRDTVVARAHANMWRHLVKATAAPVAFNADAAVFASTHQDPVAAARALGLQVGLQLGKWKHTSTLEARKAPRKAKGQEGQLRALLSALKAT